MGHNVDVMGLAYQAAYLAAGLNGTEAHACARFRAAVDAALEVLKASIAAEALRMAATVKATAGQGEGRERVYQTATLAYYSVRLGRAWREERIKAAIDAATPLIAAGALREAADASNAVPYGVHGIGDETWRRWLAERAEAIEKGEA